MSALRGGGIVLLAVLLGSVSGCDQLMQRVVRQNLAAGVHDEWLEDGALHVVFCGTGSPLPDRTRAAACTAVLAGGNFFLVDVGPGSWENVQTYRLPTGELSAVLLTHFHSDHIGELGEVVTQSWIAGRAEPLDVYGPPGVDRVVTGFQQAYGLDAVYRNKHHGKEAMPFQGSRSRSRTVGFDRPGELVTVLEDGDLRVSAFQVDHHPVDPAIGYRFDYRGRSVVISGDTAVSPNLERHAAGVDVLIHEALAGHMIQNVVEVLKEEGLTRRQKLVEDILDYHTTPEEAVAIGRSAGVKRVVLTHLVPAPNHFILRRLFLQNVPEDAPPTDLADDGLHLALPGESDEIRSDSVSP